MFASIYSTLDMEVQFGSFPIRNSFLAQSSNTTDYGVCGLEKDCCQLSESSESVVCQSNVKKSGSR